MTMCMKHGERHSLCPCGGKTLVSQAEAWKRINGLTSEVVELTAERDKLREQRDESFRVIASGVKEIDRLRSQLTAVKEALGDYLKLTDDCCKGDTACLICQHRDWFRSFIKGLTGKIVPLDTHTKALAKLDGEVKND